MLNNLKNPVGKCIKNVYNLCVQQVKSSAYLYTTPMQNSYIPKSMWVKAGSLAHNIDSFTPAIPTGILAKLPQLNSHLYTLSTAPTIKKNKKK